MEKISIVIPMIHEYPSIYATINSLQTELMDNGVYDWEIIVAENGTVDENTPRAFTGDRALYRELLRRGRIKYVFEPRQCGPVARNTGARDAATGDFVMFMDAHTTPGKDSIVPLAQHLDDHKEVGCVQGLTSWSYYDYTRMGGFYGLFHPHDKQYSAGGGPTLPSHMHGHYLTPGHTKKPWREVAMKKKPFPCVMGSQAYTMYRREQFLNIGGYFDEARFYPHPEGYMPLKVWMCGGEVWTIPTSWHIHGMYPRTYGKSNAQKIVDELKALTLDDISMDEVKQIIQMGGKEEVRVKIEEYGGMSWAEHGMRNVFMIAMILGDIKWLEICLWAFQLRKRPKSQLIKIAQSAIDTVESSGEMDRLRNNQEMSLDEVLIRARKEEIPGMAHWFDKIGPDPK